MSVKILECDVKSQTNKQTNNKSKEKKETKDKNDKHPFQIVGQRSIYVDIILESKASSLWLNILHSIYVFESKQFP